jgi:hypothetical protein
MKKLCYRIFKEYRLRLFGIPFLQRKIRSAGTCPKSYTTCVCIVHSNREKDSNQPLIWHLQGKSRCLHRSKYWMQGSHSLVLENVDTLLEWFLKTSYVTSMKIISCKKIRTGSIFLHVFGCQDTDNTRLTQKMCPKVW